MKRCRIHKIRNVAERNPQGQGASDRWVMTQEFKLDAAKGKSKLKEQAEQLKARYQRLATHLEPPLEGRTIEFSTDSYLSLGSGHRQRSFLSGFLTHRLCYRAHRFTSL